MIIRPDYIEAIKPFIDVPLVKILAGVRRCGKSTILAMMAEELEKRGISKENIIERRYNEMDFDDSITAKDMYNDLKDAIRGKGKCYLFLDEIQEVSGSIPLISTIWFVKRTVKSLENTTFSRFFLFRGTFAFASRNSFDPYLTANLGCPKSLFCFTPLANRKSGD